MTEEQKGAERPRASFDGDVEPCSVPLGYRVGVVVTAVTMVLLAAVYVGMILGVGWLVYLHATVNASLFETEESVRAALLFYLGPLVIGVLMILFMVKPFFARRADVRAPVVLDPEDQPALFRLVERLCEVIQAPVPTEIRIDNQVNASAAFRRGMASFAGRDLVLTIGMPLAAGLSLRELTGVLAHEFGHFAQGAGMRLSYVIRSMNAWFHRVVYERDSWDKRLEDWGKTGVFASMLVVQLSRLFIWISRKILFALMWIGHVVSSYLLRQMEYDADRYEVRVCGADVFQSTSERIVTLSVADQLTRRDLAMYWEEGRLPDNMAAHVVLEESRFTAEARANILERQLEVEPGRFDTHPTMSQRIAAARSEGGDGVFRSELAGQAVFRQFDDLCREATIDYYEMVLGRSFDRKALRPVEDLQQRKEDEAERFEALGRYFQGALVLHRALPVEATRIESPAAPKESALAVKEARREVVKLADSYRRANELETESWSRLVEVDQAMALARAGKKPSRSKYRLDDASLDGIRDARKVASEAQREAQQGFDEFERIAAQRLMTALSLLKVETVQTRVEDAEGMIAEAERLLEALSKLGAAFPMVTEMVHSHYVLGILLQEHPGEGEHKAYSRVFLSRIDHLRDRVVEIRDSLMDVSYPFDHAEGEISVGAFLLAQAPRGKDVNAIAGCSERVRESLRHVYFRVLSRLAAIAETAEQAIGLSPIPAPDPGKAPSAAAS